MSHDIFVISKGVDVQGDRCRIDTQVLLQLLTLVDQPQPLSGTERVDPVLVLELRNKVLLHTAVEVTPTQERVACLREHLRKERGWREMTMDDKW